MGADALIYPGLGFGALLAKSRTLTHSMIIAGTQRLAGLAPALHDPDQGLLPDFEDAPSVNFEVGIAVCEQAINEGIAGAEWDGVIKKAGWKDIVRKRAEEVRWKPVYAGYEYHKGGLR